MTDNPNELTIENSVVVLIDHQPAPTGEWAPGWASPERATLGHLIAQHGGTATLGSDYVMAQLTAGIVPTPGCLSNPDLAGAS
jgi:hypothetical protein